LGKRPDITLVNFLLNYTGAYGPWLPLNCLALITSLLKEGISVDFRDYQLVERNRFLDLVKMTSFFDDSSDIIAISCYSHALPFVIKTTEKIKERESHKKIILGGLGSRFVAADLMEKFRCFDLIATGDDPRILPELVKTLKDGNTTDYEDIPGVCYRNGNDEIVFTPQNRSKSRGHMNDSMIPAFEMLPLHLYETAPILSAKGCIYKCPFCCIPNVHSAYIQRDLLVVKEEVRFLSKQDGPRTYYLIDEAFLHNQTRTYDFLDFIGQSQFLNETEFKCYGRVNLIDEALMKDLSRSRFSCLYFGVESGSNKVLRRIKKGFTIEEAVETIIKCRKYFSKTIASFIYGFPFETFDDFLETMYTVWRLHGLNISLQFHLLAPLPGTALYKDYRSDLTLSPEIASYMSAPYLEPSIENMEPVAHLIQEYPHIFPSIYHFKSPRIEEKERIVNDLRSIVFFDESQ